MKPAYSQNSAISALVTGTWGISMVPDIATDWPVGDGPIVPTFAAEMPFLITIKRNDLAASAAQPSVGGGGGFEIKAR